MASKNWQIIKRDGTPVKFKKEKIYTAIAKAGQATGELTTKKAIDALTRNVAVVLENKFYLHNNIPTIEDIQNEVERVLMTKYPDTAKAYILYREDRARVRKTIVNNYVDMVDDYIHSRKGIKQENSNTNFSIQGMHNRLNGIISEAYWLHKVYNEAIRKAHQSGDFHIHDLSFIGSYCMGWDLMDILRVGITGVRNVNHSAPAKHFGAALGQVWNFLYALQGESAGAQAISSFDTLLAPFVRHDNLTYAEVKQHMQVFLHNMNNPNRVGFQCVPMDHECYTPSGWKKYEELKKGDRIFVVDIRTGRITTDVIVNLLSYSYNGDMGKFKNRDGDEFLVTLRHSVVFKNLDNELDMEFCEFLPLIENEIDIPMMDKIKWDGTNDKYVDMENCKSFECSHVPFDGAVWCPTTQHGTFICRSPKSKPFLTGNCPFTNITFDLVVPKHLQKTPIIIGGVDQDSTYSEYQEEMDMINKAFCEVMIDGDSDGRIFSFPIPTYSIVPNFDWDGPRFEPIARLTARYGSPYFTNYIGSGMDPADIRAMCPIHPRERIRFKDNEVEILTSMEDMFKMLEGRDLSKVYVQFLNEWIPVSKVMKMSTAGFRRLVSTKEIIGTILDVRHLQPVRKTRESKMEVVTCNEIKPGMYIPYVDGFGNEPCFYADGMWWYQVVSNDYYRDPTNHHCYCIEVNSEEHLFQLANGLITHNCRLMLDNRELRKRGVGLFGSAPLTGANGVVTLNLPKIGYLASGMKRASRRKADRHTNFYALLKDRLDLAVESLLIKKVFVEDAMENDMYPFTKFYLRDVKARHGKYLANHFNVIGIIGGNECCLNYMNCGIKDPKGKKFMCEVMDYIRDYLLQKQIETGELFNLEATPGESAGYRLAMSDKQKFDDIKTAPCAMGDPTPYYTNSTHLPVDTTVNIFDVLEHQDDLQTRYTGGTMLHTFLGECLEDPNTVKDIVRKIATNFRLPYFSITPTFSVCQNHGYLKGAQYSCPTCDSTTEVYSRIVGYYRPVSCWNKGKQAEFNVRAMYTEFEKKKQ